MKSNLKDFQKDIIDNFIRLSKINQDKINHIKFRLGYEIKKSEPFEDIIYTNLLD